MSSPQCLERAMKFAFEEFHLWFQLSLSLMAAGKVNAPFYNSSVPQSFHGHAKTWKYQAIVKL